MNFFSGNKDALTAIGIILTFLISSISLYFSVRNNKAVHYVNSVTKSRIEWIDQLRLLAVEFCNACDLGGYKKILCEDETPDVENIDKIKKVAMQIKFMLNYSDDLDIKIIEIMDNLVTLTSTYYDIFDCVNHYLDEDNHIDIKKYCIQNLYDKEKYVQEYVIRFCKQKNIEVDEPNFWGRTIIVKQCLEKIKSDEVMWNELNINFIADFDNTLCDIENNRKLFNKYIQIYLKAEWNRVKYESKGKIYEKDVQKFDLKELEEKYDNPKYWNKIWKRRGIVIWAKIRKILPFYIIVNTVLHKKNKREDK